MKRETAWRVFAGEFNDSTVEIKGQGEMSPSYIVTPLGAKVNRVFVIGVLTDVEKISEDGELLRAHISDPTGVFTLYSGQYQKDVTDILSKIEVPAFVAVIGKARTYSPEVGTLYVSLRPENIMEVSADIRDKWILETCKHTKDRIDAVLEAMKMNQLNTQDLKKLGFNTDLSEGVVEALKSYGSIDINKYVRLIHESLQYLKPRTETLPDLDEKTKKDNFVEKEDELFEEEEKENKSKKEDKEKVDEKKDNFEETEKIILELIKKVEGEDGAPWDLITEKCEKAGLDKDSIEEALNSLMDKGLIYEPVLGTIKST
jgi:RPA family protein